MNRALKLPILLTGLFLSILVSFSAFSIRSEASTSLPLQIGLYSYSGGWYANYVYDSNCPGDYYIGLTKGFDLDPNGWSVMIFTQYTGNFSVHYGTDYSFGARDYYNVDCNSSNRRSYTVDGSVYYGWRVNSLADYYVPSVTLYNSIPEAIRDLSKPIGPEFSNFGLSDFQYITYKDYTGWLLIPNPIYTLNYYITWNGSSDPDFPITEVQYSLYGYRDVAMSNFDTSNGVLVDSGTCSSPFDYDVYNKVKNWNNTTDYQKFVVYLTPYSGVTQGNTHYIVCNLFKSNVQFDGGYLEVDVGDLLGMESIFGDSVIPVPVTQIVNDGSNSEGASSIDGVPVTSIIQQTSGSYNTYYDMYISQDEYSPVIYGDSTEIQNYYDSHDNIFNNSTVNNIVNNINGSVNIDPDNNSSVASLIDFLKTLITFFATCWNLFSGSMTFIPSWAVNIVTVFYSLTGSILVGIVILKLIRG